MRQVMGRLVLAVLVGVLALPAQAKDGIVEILGAVQALPAAGFVGDWRVSGRLVRVTATTLPDAGHGAFPVGAPVEVHGRPDAVGALVATRIERTAGNGAPALALLFWGTVEAMPAVATAPVGLWRRTGQAFNVGGGSAAVCRFYGMPPKGPDSHFFTVDAAECAKVMRDYQAWTCETHAFSIAEPTAGACAPGQVPVVRFYNNPSAGADVNHRYVTSAQVAAEMRGRGWIEEGVVMCARP